MSGVGEVASIIGIIDFCFKAGKELTEIAERYQQADGTYNLFYQFGVGISRGMLATQLELFKKSERRLSNELRLCFQEVMSQLESDLLQAKFYLEQHAPSRGSRRVRWALWAENRARKLVDDLESHQRRVSDLFIILNLKDVVRSDNLRALQKRELRVDRKTRIVIKKRIEWVSVGKADLDLGIGDKLEDSIGVLIESCRTFDSKAKGDSEKSKEIGRLLYGSLDRDTDYNTYQSGLLPCLGFQGNWVIFRLPRNADLTKVQTLQDWIDESRGQPSKKVPLEERFRIALQLSRAVLKIHTAGVVHRNIRSETIMLLRSGPPVSQQGRESDTDSDDRGRDGKRRKEKHSRKREKKKSHRERSSSRTRPGLGRRHTFIPPELKRRFTLRNITSKFALGNHNDDDEKSGTESSRSEEDESGSKHELKDHSKEPEEIPPGLGSIYLTCWWNASQLRNSPREDRSLHSYEHVYRHPQRYFKRDDQREKYNIGHEIYSLGVCLLEIGIWEALIQWRHKSKSFKPSNRLDSVKDGYDTIRTFLLTQDGPSKLKEFLIYVAEQELPVTMGTGYKDLVIACLTCLDPEPSVDWGVKFNDGAESGEALEAKIKKECLAFQNHVISFLEGVNVGKGSALKI
jgi:serine/threonine protein kinase